MNHALEMILACTITVALLRPARGSDLPPKLTWSAPPECAGESFLREQLRRVPARASARAAPALDVQVSIDQQRNGSWRAIVITRGTGAGGERVLVDQRCDDIVRAVALVLALTPNDDAVSRREQGRALPPDEAPSRARVAVGVEVALVSGTVPGLDTGASGRLLVEGALASLELRLGALLPRRTLLAGQPTAEAAFGSASAGIVGCVHEALRGPWGVQGCAGSELAWLRVATSGVSEPGSASAIWPRLFLEAALRYQLTPDVRLRLAAQGGRNELPPRFGLAGHGVFFQPSPWLLRAAFGAELSF